MALQLDLPQRTMLMRSKTLPPDHLPHALRRQHVGTVPCAPGAGRGGAGSGGGGHLSDTFMPDRIYPNDTIYALDGTPDLIPPSAARL